MVSQHCAWRARARIQGGGLRVTHHFDGSARFVRRGPGVGGFLVVGALACDVRAGRSREVSKVAHLRAVPALKTGCRKCIAEYCTVYGHGNGGWCLSRKEGVNGVQSLMQHECSCKMWQKLFWLVGCSCPTSQTAPSRRS